MRSCGGELATAARDVRAAREGERIRVERRHTLSFGARTWGANSRRQAFSCGAGGKFFGAQRNAGAETERLRDDYARTGPTAGARGRKGDCGRALSRTFARSTVRRERSCGGGRVSDYVGRAAAGEAVVQLERDCD